MKIIDKFLFSFISTSWIIIVYSIDKKSTWFFGSYIFTTVFMMSMPLLLSGLWLLFIKVTKSSENISSCNCVCEISNDFLANYLGYFFIGLGLDDVITLIIAFVVIFVFTFASPNQYFNAVLLIFGYKYYSVETSEGTKILLISRTSYRNSVNVNSSKLKRINNGVFLEVR